jgi:TolB protein
MHINRRTFAAASGLALALPAAQAQFRVEIAGVGSTQLPIAIARFRDEERAPQPVSAIIRADLERSGAFRLIDSNQGLDEVATPRAADWRGLGADMVVGGSLTRLADGHYELRIKLWDVVRGKEVGAMAEKYAPASLRHGAHRVADYLYEKLTGEKGVFSTRIAYVRRSGKLHTLMVADADGENAQIAINPSAAPIISPTWSPNGRELAFVSFLEKQKAVVYAQDIVTGVVREIANFKGSNSAPAWAPDGRSLAVALSRDGNTQIYIVGRNGESPRRLTHSGGIDTEPVFSPDGKWVYFVSDRSGGPQVYRQPVAGGNAERVTFTGGYNISPALSADGRMLAYISRQGGAFKLYVTELAAGATPRALTDSSDDESPSFAPNGRFILYATRVDGRDTLMVTTLDGKTKAKLVSTSLDLREPAWGPY